MRGWSAGLLAAALGIVQSGCGLMPAADPEASVTTVYVLRHAEKQPDDTADPALSPRGARRAQALADSLESQPLDAVFATQYRRTHDTVAPLALRAGLPVTIMEAGDTAGVAARIRHEHAGGTVVVAGHSNTVPLILAELGARSPGQLDDDDYGDLFRVTLRSGVTTVETQRFGD